MSFSPSPEQQTVFDTALTTPSNIFVRATAGSGKTTTIVELCKRIGPGSKVVFLAFNKNIADELSERLPYYATASTFHSYCLQALRRRGWAKGAPQARKCAALLKQFVPNWKERKDYEEDLLTLISRAKSTGYGALYQPGFAEDATGEEILRDLADKFGLALDNSHLALAERILDFSLADKATVDFDDMLLFALDPSVSFDHLGWCIVDEAQDTNGVQRALLRKICNERISFTSNAEWPHVKPSYDNHFSHEQAQAVCNGLELRGFGGDGQVFPVKTWVEPKATYATRLVAVGDPSQSIYGFRGADSDACKALVEAFNMVELPLSVTYRCSQAVTAEARKYESGLESKMDPNPHAKIPQTLIDPDESIDPMDFFPEQQH